MNYIPILTLSAWAALINEVKSLRALNNAIAESPVTYSPFFEDADENDDGERLCSTDSDHSLCKYLEGQLPQNGHLELSPTSADRTEGGAALHDVWRAEDPATPLTPAQQAARDNAVIEAIEHAQYERSERDLSTIHEDREHYVHHRDTYVKDDIYVNFDDDDEEKRAAAESSSSIVIDDIDRAVLRGTGNDLIAIARVGSGIFDRRCSGSSPVTKPDDYFKDRPQDPDRSSSPVSSGSGQDDYDSAFSGFQGWPQAMDRSKSKPHPRITTILAEDPFSAGFYEGKRPPLMRSDTITLGDGYPQPEG